MISPLTITSLTQGNLYGEKPTIEELDRHGAIYHPREISAWVGNRLAGQSLDWRDLFASSSARAVKGWVRSMQPS